MFWTDFDRSFAALDELRRRMDRVWDEVDRGDVRGRTSLEPRAALHDAGDALVLVAEVPGVTREALQLSVHEEVLTLAGERTVEVPEGYKPHRRERRAVRFARSFSVPCKVDLEKTSAQLADGILTVRMAKAPESQPRRIQVNG